MNRFALAAVAALAASSASAATVTQQAFSQTNWTNAVSGQPAVVENFEALGQALGGAAGKEYLNKDGGLTTAVGTFTRNGGAKGSGSTVTDTVAKSFGNTGEGVALRSGFVYGREDTTKVTQGVANANWFFDSNDLEQVRWDVTIGGGLFNKLVFALTDPADQGATFSICTGTFGCSDFQLTKQSPSSKRLITVDFGSNVDTATIFFSSLPKNDGWGVDDIAVSAVPLPAPALMLIAGLGALGAAARRKRKAA
jgi:hypothetical protein